MRLTTFEERLIHEKAISDRCKLLRQDDIGPYCGKDLNPEDKVSEQRRMVCDVYSLQLWCLDKTSCCKCIFYNGSEKIM